MAIVAPGTFAHFRAFWTWWLVLSHWRLVRFRFTGHVQNSSPSSQHLNSFSLCVFSIKPLKLFLLAEATTHSPIQNILGNPSKQLPACPHRLYFKIGLGVRAIIQDNWLNKIPPIEFMCLQTNQISMFRIILQQFLFFRFHVYLTVSALEGGKFNSFNIFRFR